MCRVLFIYLLIVHVFLIYMWLIYYLRLIYFRIYLFTDAAYNSGYARYARMFRWHAVA
jgi:hypothetical protein